MENIKTELINAITERYKNNLIVNGIQKDFSRKLERMVNDKYRLSNILVNGLEYKFLDSKVDCSSYPVDMVIKDFSLSLYFIITSDLDKKTKK